MYGRSGAGLPADCEQLRTGVETPSLDPALWSLLPNQKGHAFEIGTSAAFEDGVIR